MVTRRRHERFRAFQDFLPEFMSFNFKNRSVLKVTSVANPLRFDPHDLRPSSPTPVGPANAGCG
jgi:hypothetical protein